MVGNCIQIEFICQENIDKKIHIVLLLSTPDKPALNLDEGWPFEKTSIRRSKS